MRKKTPKGLLHDLADLEEGRRTHVGAMGEAEKHKARRAAQGGLCHAATLLINQAERPADPALIGLLRQRKKNRKQSDQDQSGERDKEAQAGAACDHEVLHTPCQRDVDEFDKDACAMDRPKGSAGHTHDQNDHEPQDEARIACRRKQWCAIFISKGFGRDGHHAVYFY